MAVSHSHRQWSPERGHSLDLNFGLRFQPKAFQVLQQLSLFFRHSQYYACLPCFELRQGAPRLSGDFPVSGGNRVAVWAGLWFLQELR